ncbi:MAG: PstS family phosphate ABC transporter substrate-binding protein [Bdellovibrionota bacterium]
MNFKNKVFTIVFAMGTSLSVYANTQMVKIDGSSTVYPIIEAVAEEFSKVNPKIRVTAGVSGTGGGFKKFIAGEIDICDASRPVKDSEKAELTKKGIKYHEVKVGYDGLSVIINPANTFVDYLSTEELAKIWAPGSKVKTWADIRSTWPKKEIKLYGPGTDSGTFDFFTEVINGKSQVSRSDFTKSEDDNVLVKGVAGDKFALAYLGHAYVEENKDSLKVVPIGPSKEKAITPTTETIKNNTYAPLSRPLFIYVADKSLKKPEVKSFIEFMLKNSSKLVSEVGYVPLTDMEYQTETKVLAR